MPTLGHGDSTAKGPGEPLFVLHFFSWKVSTTYEGSQRGRAHFQSRPRQLPTPGQSRRPLPRASGEGDQAACWAESRNRSARSSRGAVRALARRGRGEPSERDAPALIYHLFPEGKDWRSQKKDRSWLTWEVKRTLPSTGGLCLVKHERTVFREPSAHPRKENEVNFPGAPGPTESAGAKSVPEPGAWRN